MSSGNPVDLPINLSLLNTFTPRRLPPPLPPGPAVCLGGDTGPTPPPSPDRGGPLGADPYDPPNPRRYPGVPRTGHQGPHRGVVVELVKTVYPSSDETPASPRVCSRGGKSSSRTLRLTGSFKTSVSTKTKVEVVTHGKGLESRVQTFCVHYCHRWSISRHFEFTDRGFLLWFCSCTTENSGNILSHIESLRRRDCRRKTGTSKEDHCVFSLGEGNV